MRALLFRTIFGFALVIRQKRPKFAFSPTAFQEPGGVGCAGRTRRPMGASGSCPPLDVRAQAVLPNPRLGVTSFYSTLAPATTGSTHFLLRVLDVVIHLELIRMRT